MQSIHIYLEPKRKTKNKTTKKNVVLLCVTTSNRGIEFGDDDSTLQKCTFKIETKRKEETKILKTIKHRIDFFVPIGKMFLILAN